MAKKQVKPEVVLDVYRLGDEWSWQCNLPRGSRLKLGWQRNGWRTPKGALNNARRELEALRLYRVWDISESVGKG